MPASSHTDSSATLSAPPSPATTMSAAHSDNDTDYAVDNSLDDIFGSSPPRETQRQSDPNATDSKTTTEPSDLPSLRRQHVTAGYRDGVSTAKGEHVQRGFDAGFPVGAQLGMRAGTILGILEGILRGLEDRSSSGVIKKPAGRAAASRSNEACATEAKAQDLQTRKRDEVLKLYREAVKALSVQSVFAASATSADQASTSATGHAENAEVQLGRKGDTVVTRWEEKMTVYQWEKNMEALEMKESSEKTTSSDQVLASDRS
ncbi:Protein yae1 [Penicillium diatomitis]|uniref:Protein YAE1 n=1 Tax=Penicillium diatomitis TaxID=2819901 RepID=A0A9W9WLH8_9EURO|nr:Protein yae1 [Penicillium diatomitis]KAJ5469694.1 Protein yae1 [Penicillium diatomitis]